MTSVQTVPNQANTPAEPAAERRERSGAGVDFGDLFAHFAHQTTLGAARNGSFSLKIGGGAGAGTAAKAAQRLPKSAQNPAPDATSLRERGDRLSDSMRESARGSRSLKVDSEGLAADRAGPGASSSQRHADSTRGATDEPAGGRPADDARAGQPAQKNHAANAGRNAAQSSDAATVATAGTPIVIKPEAARNAQIQAVQAVGKSGPTGQAPTAITGAGALSGNNANQAGSSKLARSPNHAHAPKETAMFRAQLAQGLGAALRQGKGEVTLRLRPHSLGELQVRLHIRDGTVDAQIKPTTHQAHRLLEQSVEALRHAFEARGLQPGRIEIQSPPEGKEADSGGQHAQPQGQEGQRGGGSEDRSPEESADGERSGHAGGGPGAAGEEETAAAPDGYGSPGVVYSVADGAARILMVDALA